jgi:type IV pilus biogenesis protein CpaD/CtpE
MDLAMVKQEQGETLRKYMRRFFDMHATVVDVTTRRSSTSSKTASTIAAPLKTSVVAALSTSPTSRT